MLTLCITFLQVLYIVPTASNPCGTTMGETRRREIYAIAQEFDLMILEDDPYYFIQYNDEVRIKIFFMLFLS